MKKSAFSIQALAGMMMTFFFLAPDVMASSRAIALYGLSGPESSLARPYPPVRSEVEESGIMPEVMKTGNTTLEAVIFHSEGEAFLGKHPEDPDNMPADDIFTVELAADPADYPHAYLVYTSVGLADGLSVAKSVNGLPAFVRFPLEKAEGNSQEVVFELDRAELNKGSNTIRFGLPAGITLPVSVRDVRIELTHTRRGTRPMERITRVEAPAGDFRVTAFSPAPEALLDVKVYGLKSVDMPPVPAHIRNVSRGGWGYFLSSPTEGIARVQVGVNPKALGGKDLAQVQVFFFDAAKKSWRPLPAEKVDMALNTIQASGPANTNYFAGLITAPEMPEASAFVPTAMRGLKAADPAEGMTIIQPPTANQSGSASVQYPLVIPPGRNGMTPDLNLDYDSDGGSGWLGMGWNIKVPSVSVDERWGVPILARVLSETSLVPARKSQVMPTLQVARAKTCASFG